MGPVVSGIGLLRNLGLAVLAAVSLLSLPAAAQGPAAAAPAATAPAAPAASVPPPRPAPPPTLDPVRLEAFLDGWIADAMTREHVPGVAVSVVQNGEVIFRKGYGFADLATGRRVDPDRSMFRLGSVSKTFTWILLMREVEAGRIRLDRPINLYLPERVRLPGRGADIMVRNLMDHSAGFEDLALGQLFEKDPRRVRPLELYLRQERPDIVRGPGVLSSYSNYGAALAGEATAFVSGRTFERRVEDEIALPLGMTRTTFREPRPDRRGLPAAMPQRMRADLATGYGWRGGAFVPDSYEYIGQVAPAGSASSTAGDMSRYMLMLLGDGSWNGAAVFGPRAAAAFRHPLQKTPAGINGWAHGFIVMDLPGGFTGYGHLGHTLAFQSNMTLVPSLSNLGVFVTTNSETGAKLADALPAELVRRFYAPAPRAPRQGSAQLADAAAMFTGGYITTRRAFGGLEGFVDLLGGAQAQVSVTPDGRLMLTRGGQVTAFVPEGPVGEGRFISTTGEQRLAFRIADGRAVSYRTGLNTETMERTPLREQSGVLLATAILTLGAATLTLAGLVLRNRRELRQSQVQARAAMVQVLQAGLWIIAIVLFVFWSLGAADIQATMYDWPGPLLATASTCALVAAVLTVVTVVALPALWQGGRRVESWTGLRKSAFTLTVLVYGVFSVLLALAGALAPWSG